jgi:CRP-like cAMP-binding protein
LPGDSSYVPPANSNRLLAALPPDELATLERELQHVVLEQGVVLHRPGGSIDHVYFVTTGVVSIVTLMQDGTGVEAAMTGNEGVVGAAVLSGATTALSQAVVQIAGTARRMPAPQFVAACRRSASLQSLVERYQYALLGHAQQSAACNALHSVEARLCRWLLQARDRTANDMLPLTQEFLAQMLGVQRTTVTLVEGVLQTAGLIKHHRGRIQLLDPERISDAACECYATARKNYAVLLPETEPPQQAGSGN